MYRDSCIDKFDEKNINTNAHKALEQEFSLLLAAFAVFSCTPPPNPRRLTGSR